MPRRQTFSLLLVMCVGHVLLISAQVQSKSGLPVIQSAAFDIFSRLQSVTTGIADTGRSLVTNYVALSGAARENAALQRRILDLEVNLQRERALAAQAQGLQQALELKQAQPHPMLGARVVAGNPSPGVFTVTIDRGAGDGVAPDLAVLATKGVVGRVIAPISRSAATVQLLVGRNAAAAVVFERSGAGGIAVGGLNPSLLTAEYVPVLADIQVGERVTTSGQDGIYPPGFLVGTVERVTRPSSAADRVITVRPAVDFSHVELVLVVLTAPAPPGGGS
ncbi:MAG: rod shape-determining protein MreC [Vicinamibacterales bacterium]